MANPVYISFAGLTALTWVFTVAALLLTAGRFAIRYKSGTSFIASDYINALACVFLVGYMATYTSTFQLYYDLEYYVAGLGPAVGDDRLVFNFKTQAAVSMLFWVVIYLVKASFLMLYYFVFRHSYRFIQIWWATAIFTTICFFISFISVLWECGYNPAHDLFKPVYCLGPDAVTASVHIVKFWCAINVFSDLLIISLPIYMLRQLQMSFVAKAGIAFIFALALIDVAFDIVRTVYAVDSFNAEDGGTFSINAIWDILEPPIAVMVCAMPTYRNAQSLLRKKVSSTDKKSESFRGLQDITQQSSTGGTIGNLSANRSEAKTWVSSMTNPSRLPTTLSTSAEDDTDRNGSGIWVERTFDVQVTSLSGTGTPLSQEVKQADV